MFISVYLSNPSKYMDRTISPNERPLSIALRIEFIRGLNLEQGIYIDLNINR